MATLTLDKVHESSQANHLWWRIGLLLILVIAFVLSLISFLNYSNYRKNYLELNLTRYLIMGKDLRQTIESGLNIGIFPAENLNLRPTMKELAQRQMDTRYIGILDESGIVIQEGNFPANIPAHWQTLLERTAADAYWQDSDASHFEIGMPFSNNFNLKTGAVVIGYDRGAIEAATSNMRRKIILNLLQTLLLCAVVIFGGCWLLTRKLASNLSIIDQALKLSLQAPQPVQVSEALLGSAMAQDINAFTAISHQVAQELNQLEADALASAKGGRP